MFYKYKDEHGSRIVVIKSIQGGVAFVIPVDAPSKGIHICLPKYLHEIRRDWIGAY